jgi:outer membrane immunogenic protein
MVKRARFSTAVVALGIAGISASAFAADLRVKAPPVVAAAAYSWSGWYIGANVGGAWGSFDNTLSIVNGPPGDSFFNPADLRRLNQVSATGTSRIGASGFTGGFQAGYNIQRDRVVFGGEVDFNVLALRGERSGIFGYVDDPAHLFSLSTTAKTSWLMTVRPRIGYVVDRALFYATGGLAVADVRFDQSFRDFAPACAVAFCSGNASGRTTRVGYAVGGGVEYAVAGRWTAKGEYLYVNFGSTDVSGLIGVPAVGAGTATLNNSVRVDAHILRLGMNYRLDGGAIVARY